MGYLNDSTREILPFNCFFFLLSRCLMIKILEDEGNTNKSILNLRAHFRLKSKNYFQSILLLFMLICRSPFSFILRCKFNID